MVNKVLWNTLIGCITLFGFGLVLFGASILNADYSWLKPRLQNTVPKTTMQLNPTKKQNPMPQAAKDMTTNHQVKVARAPEPSTNDMDNTLAKSGLEEAINRFQSRPDIYTQENFAPGTVISSHTNERGENVEIIKTPDGQEFGRKFKNGQTQSVMQKTEDAWEVFHFDEEGDYLYSSYESGDGDI